MIRRFPLKRRTGLRARAITPKAWLKELCDELARVVTMTKAGAAWCPPERGEPWRSRTWIGRCARDPHKVCVLQWSHFITRGCLRLRHEPDNTHAIGVGAHKFFTHHPVEFEDWMIERLGHARVVELKRLARIPSKTDLSGLAVALEAEVRALGAGEQVEYARERLARRRK